MNIQLYTYIILNNVWLCGMWQMSSPTLTLIGMWQKSSGDRWFELHKTCRERQSPGKVRSVRVHDIPFSGPDERAI